MDKLHKKTEDLTGRVFEKLTVLGFAGYKIQSTSERAAYWECKCLCGNKKIVRASTLKNGDTKSCGDCNPIKVGDIFGKLTVLSFGGYRVQKGCNRAQWLCECECGNKILVLANSLKTKLTRSCHNCNPIKVGDVFGKLTVLKKVSPKLLVGGEHKEQWLCRCSCGNEKTILANDLKRGHTKSCGCIPSTPSGGYSEKYNLSYDSLWELDFVKILEYLEVKWEREPKKFKLSNGKIYIPDFYLIEFNIFIEIKGRWFEGAKEKTELFKKEYSEYKYYVIDEVKYIQLETYFKNIL